MPITETIKKYLLKGQELKVMETQFDSCITSPDQRGIKYVLIPLLPKKTVLLAQRKMFIQQL